MKGQREGWERQREGWRDKERDEERDERGVVIGHNNWEVERDLPNKELSNMPHEHRADKVEPHSTAFDHHINLQKLTTIIQLAEPAKVNNYYTTSSV